MKLYHAPISTCSQKVRLVLAEKELDYESEFLDLQKGDQFQPEYLSMNPGGVVPTLTDDGNVLIESTLINEYLEDAYPEPSLTPATPAARHLMRLWCKRIDELHSSCGVQTYAIGIRPGLLKRSAEEIELLINSIPDPARRGARRSVVDHGVDAPEFALAYQAHQKFFALAERQLAATPYLAGAAFSLADAALLPYVLRIDHLNLNELLDGHTALQDWYQRIRQRPSYDIAVADFLPDAAVAVFRRAGEAVAEEVRRTVAQLADSG